MTTVALLRHSTASPDAASPPGEVTFTDRDAIHGAVGLAERHKDACVSVDLTMAGETLRRVA